MSGNSSVGTSGVYEAGDQRNVKASELNKATPYEEGKEHSHKPNDSKDERSIANRLANEERKEKEGDHDDPMTAAQKKDPTLPAQLHGNEPSKGAKIDAELQAEDEAALKKKSGK
ncbi:Uu.00g110780.m01.CDS01 [Anthostomella pinea]|uniref:Uu.00g110780.m01.CDS01 n=1 Tax=Anthostomella pinea TaxID=933095 RepID=A0AAI8VFY1_9PEZI|nr:Uu.00g110780.m01.CDS01 [Anthostomella pinea]